MVSREPEMILEAGEGHLSGVELQASNIIVGFGNEVCGETLKIFDSHTSLTKAIEAYLWPLLSFSLVIVTFEIFR